MILFIIKIVAVVFTFITGVLIFLDIATPPRWMLGVTYMLFAVSLAVLAFAKGIIINIYNH